MGYDAAPVSGVSKKSDGFIFKDLSKRREPDEPKTQNHIPEQGNSRTRHRENPKTRVLPN